MGHDPAVLVMVAVMGTGFCQTLMASAKPVAIFRQAEGAGFAPADLLRLALPLAPVTAVLVTLFALAVWPRQLAALQDVTMALPLTTKERAAIAALPETPAAPQAMATTPHDQIRGRISPAVPALTRAKVASDRPSPPVQDLQAAEAQILRDLRRLERQMQGLLP